MWWWRGTPLSSSAPRDGATDDTSAIQRALDAQAKVGGGTVFLPEGRYAVRGTLVVPTGVVLRRDWAKPSPVKGTILMAYAGRGSVKGTPFLKVEHSACVRDLSIWYPEQQASAIVEYPPSIVQQSEWQKDDSSTVENVTFVNSYWGFAAGLPNNGRHLLHNLYGSLLSTGIEIEHCTAIGRTEVVSFSPDYWSDSGLPGAPPRKGPHARWMYRNGTGIRIYRSDWEYLSFIDVTGYQFGFAKLKTPYGTGTGQAYGRNFSKCATALYMQYCGFNGFRFTANTFSGDEYGIVTGKEFEEYAAFHSCNISGKTKAAALAGEKTATGFFRTAPSTARWSRRPATWQ